MFVPLYDTNPRRHVRAPVVAWGLIAACVLAQLAVGAAGPGGAQAAFYVFGLVPAVFNDLVDLPAAWRVLPERAGLLTYMFLHGGWLHLAGNMLFLWVFGDNVEDAMGHWRFLAFYLACGAGAGLAYALIGQQVSEAPLVGASGAVAGVIAAYLLLYPRVRVWVLLFGKIPLPIRASWCLLAWAGFQLVSLVFQWDPEVAFIAHVAGFVVGAALVAPLKRREVPLFGGAA